MRCGARRGAGDEHVGQVPRRGDDVAGCVGTRRDHRGREDGVGVVVRADGSTREQQRKRLQPATDDGQRVGQVEVGGRIALIRDVDDLRTGGRSRCRQHTTADGGHTGDGDADGNLGQYPAAAGGSPLGITGEDEGGVVVRGGALSLQRQRFLGCHDRSLRIADDVDLRRRIGKLILFDLGIQSGHTEGYALIQGRWQPGSVVGQHIQQPECGRIRHVLDGVPGVEGPIEDGADRHIGSTREQVISPLHVDDVCRPRWTGQQHRDSDGGQEKQPLEQRTDPGHGRHTNPIRQFIIRNDNLFLGTTGITGTAPPRAGAAAVVRRCKSAAEGRRVRILFRPNMIGEMVGDHRY